MPKLNKLVRDDVPGIMAAKDQRIRAHIADEKEFRNKLCEKLNEEVREFQETGAVQELADILEVLYQLAQLHNISKEELDRMRREKEASRGGYSKRIILDDAESPSTG